MGSRNWEPAVAGCKVVFINLLGAQGSTFRRPWIRLYKHRREFGVVSAPSLSFRIRPNSEGLTRILSKRQGGIESPRTGAVTSSCTAQGDLGKLRDTYCNGHIIETQKHSYLFSWCCVSLRCECRCRWLVPVAMIAPR